MKLTRKLSLGVGLSICIVLAAHAWTRVVSDSASYRADVARDHLVVGRSIASVVEMLWESDGMMSALEAVERQNARTNDITIRWVELGGDAAPEDAPRVPRQMPARGGEATSRVVDGGGTPHILTYYPVDVDHGPRAAIELYESLSGEREFQARSLRRAALTTSVLMLVCLGLTIGFGAVFVARPLRLVVAKAERVGRGDLEGPITLAQDDEIRDLARAINEMCEHLAESRMREHEAVDQLRHADRLRTVGEIASGVAHELGTPLNVVRVRGAMIAAGEVPEARMRELGQVIVEQADRISTSIRQLLDYARRVPSHRAPVRASSIATRVLAMVQPMASKRGVSLVARVQDAAVEVHADANQLEQAVTNLVVNAIQASESGGEITVAVRREATSAIIEVIDHGAGIADEDLSRVVEPFFTKKRAGEGTGLGLPIAIGIVRDHEGVVEIRSVVGQGTTVLVRMPAR